MELNIRDMKRDEIAIFSEKSILINIFIPVSRQRKDSLEKNWICLFKMQYLLIYSSNTLLFYSTAINYKLCRRLNFWVCFFIALIMLWYEQNDESNGESTLSVSFFKIFRSSSRINFIICLRNKMTHSIICPVMK